MQKSTQPTTFGPLTQYQLIEFAGNDVAQFLQGQFSSNIDALKPTLAQPTLYCTAKGRVILSGWILQQSNAQYALITHSNMVDDFLTIINKYAMLSRIKTNLNSNLQIIGIQPNNNQTQNTQHNQICHTLWPHNLSFMLTNQPQPTQQNQLAWQTLLFEHYWVDINPNTSQQYTPHMLGLITQNCVSFTKGCFLGQEIIARTQHLGTAKRGLHQISFTKALDANCTQLELTLNNKTIGSIVSIHPTQPKLALAILPYAQIDNITQINHNNNPAISAKNMTEI